MLLRVTGIFDRGYGLLYIIFGLAFVIGHELEWRSWKWTGSHFRMIQTSKQTEAVT